eukprot:6183616-Pleurochrysis_carterae.AAC.4
MHAHVASYSNVGVEPFLQNPLSQRPVPRTSHTVTYTGLNCGGAVILMSACTLPASDYCMMFSRPAVTLNESG